MFQRPFRFCLLVWKGPVSNRASDISRKKKQDFAGFFQGQIRGKIGRFRGIFAGKKSKFVEKSAHFAEFPREKSQTWRNNQPISGILAEKRQFSKDFQGQILGKIGRFHGKFWGGNFVKKQSVKNSRFRWIFFRKFRYDDMTLVNVSFNRNNHLLFQQQLAINNSY